MTDPAEILRERRGRWVLPVEGGEVTQVLVDFAFGLVISTYGEHSTTVTVRIETPFVFRSDGVSVTIDPANTADLGPLVTLHKAAVEEAYAIKDGHLVVTFSGRRAIEVSPHDQYEAWHVQGHRPPIERRFELIAVPSGGIARF